jgi:hypothetical protein
MSDTRDVLDEIVWNVFVTGVHVVPFARLSVGDTPQRLQQRWGALVGSARAHQQPAL